MPPLLADPSAFARLVADVVLTPGELSVDQIVEGAPRVAEQVLLTSADGRWEVGVWEITPGTCTDVEVEEAFVVLSGRATVQVQDGPELALAPGVVGAFPAGARTVWRVHETLRKVYSAAL